MNKAKLKCDTCGALPKSIFCDLPHDKLHLMSQGVSTNTYKPREIIFSEGETPLGLYCLAKGKVKVIKMDENGHQHIMRIAGPGDIVGYRSLLLGHRHSVTAQVLDETTLCFVEKNIFFQILETHPPTAFKVMRHMASDLRDTEGKNLQMIYKDVRERLAEALLVLQKKFGHPVPGGFFLDIQLTREELAEIVGTTQESVIRLISEFKQQGLIQVDGRRITLMNIQGLSHLAHLVD